MNWLINQTIDLARPSAVETPEVWVALGDRLAHAWRVTILQDGAAVDLTGATVSAYVLRDDGTTVPIVGSVIGNIAVTVLPQECYAVVTGNAADHLMSMRITLGDVTLTTAHAVLHVRRDASDTAVNPGEIVPNLADLLAVVPAAQAATLAAQIAANMDAGLNLHKNTGFFANTDGWSLPGICTRDAAKSLFGANAIKFNRTGLGADALTGLTPAAINRVPCAVGDMFTASAWVYMDDYTTVDSTNPIFIGVNFYDASGAYLEGSSGYLTPTAANNGKWVRLTASRTASNANAAFALAILNIRRNGVFWVAAIKLERGSVATDWRPSWADIINPATYYGKGAEIPSGSNLNDYIQAGSYAIMSGAIAAGITNCPYTGSGGRLEVKITTAQGASAADSFLFQEYTSHNLAGGRYLRSCAGGTWSGWYKLAMTAI